MASVYDFLYRTWSQESHDEWENDQSDFHWLAPTVSFKYLHLSIALGSTKLTTALSALLGLIFCGSWAITCRVLASESHGWNTSALDLKNETISQNPSLGRKLWVLGGPSTWSRTSPHFLCFALVILAIVVNPMVLIGSSKKSKAWKPEKKPVGNGFPVGYLFIVSN